VTNTHDTDVVVVDRARAGNDTPSTHALMREAEPCGRFQPGRIGAPSVTRSRPAMAARN
jgi:hypothetical protein